MKACFMGLGYIGLPTAIIAAKHGVDVLGVDINPNVVEMTNQGKLHIIEPGLEECLQEVVATQKLKASTTAEKSDAYFIVVPTPFKGNHEPDISYVEAATRSVLPLLKEGDLYVIESTSPVGTTEKMQTLGRRECMFFIQRSPGDHDGTTWVGDQVIRCVHDRRYPERYRDRRMDGRRQYVCS